MAALDFPLNPTTASEVTTGDITWKWNGYAWYATTDGSQVIHVGSTPPSPALEGQMWWADTDIEEGGGRLYIYTGEEWVDTSLPGGESAGGGSGDGSGSGADAWGYTTVGGGFLNGLNIASMNNSATGVYEYTFTTPMPSAQYSIQATAYTGGDQVTANYTVTSATGFTIEIRNGSGVLANSAHTFTVHATNALPPRGGTGADAWAVTQSDGTLDGGFNFENAKVVKAAEGTYDYTFTSPMPSANYAVVGTSVGSSSIVCRISSKTTGFHLYPENAGA